MTPDPPADTVLLSYREVAERLDIDAASVRRRAARSRWRRVKGNDGTVRVQVPAHVLRRPPDAGPPPDRLAELAALTRDLSADLSATRERAARAEGEAAAVREALARELERVQHERGRAERAGIAQRKTEERLEATRAELAQWTAGGPFARALRAFLNRRSRP